MSNKVSRQKKGSKNGATVLDPSPLGKGALVSCISIGSASLEVAHDDYSL